MACGPVQRSLPKITSEDIQKAKNIESTLQDEIFKGELVEAMKGDDALEQRGIVISGIMSRLIRMVMPKHLEIFNQIEPPFVNKEESFVEFKGVYGRCYQFRLFYKYNDPRIKGVEWASSVLSVPAKDQKNTKAGVVLAPSLDGFNPLLEAGLWLKLCRSGIASLMPESIYQKNSNSWNKELFDPTPSYRDVEEYTLYEDSIRRYEFVLNKNLELLRSYGSIKTEKDQNLSDFNVMVVEPERVGFWGSSFGAVVGALVIAKDPKIKGAVLSVGGGDLPYIISRSKISLFKKTREQQMSLLGLKNIEEYRDFIATYIESDPLRFAKQSDAPRLHMILANKDNSVPTYAQNKLLQKFGRPSNGRIQNGHIFTLLYTSWFNSNTSQTAIDSLIKKLGSPLPASPKPD